MKRRSRNTINDSTKGPSSLLSLNGNHVDSMMKKRNSGNDLSGIIDDGADPVADPDVSNYILLIALYTLQGIPMGLTASIPFLIQQKIKALAVTAADVASSAAGVDISNVATSAGNNGAIATQLYNAQAIFALCSWPFSLKLLWAPIVDAVYFKRIGRRKSWLIPVQTTAGALMYFGSEWIDKQLEVNDLSSFDVKGMTCFFFGLYFLMATQDIAVDGWALTMLSKANRGRGPLCNSIGQNIGYFLSYVGFLALNDAETSDKVWRPLFGIKNRETGEGLVSLGGFLKAMGCVMLAITAFVALFKSEVGEVSVDDESNDDDDDELDASKIGLIETYKRLWHVSQLPAVKTMFLILLTYRFPTSLSDNVKTLKAVEFGLSKQTISLLSPIIILPIGIMVPIIGSKIFHGHPLKQFMTAYKVRVTLVAIFDIAMLLVVRSVKSNSNMGTTGMFWFTVIGSTALQAIVAALQFNAQMTFFASRVDPSIGGSYMTLLNTMANLGGTWPASVIMFLVGKFTVPEVCTFEKGIEVCNGGRDAYFPLQVVLSAIGLAWIFFLGKSVQQVSVLPESAWRTNSLEDEKSVDSALEKGRRSNKKKS